MKEAKTEKKFIELFTKGKFSRSGIFENIKI